MKKALNILVVVVMMLCLTAGAVFAEDETAAAAAASNAVTTTKAITAAATIGLVAGIGAIAMTLAIRKTAESISRQPEAGSQLQSSMMLGLVFIETAIIYALIIAILIIFVL